MSTVNVKMTAIADEIRTLSGTTDPMGLDAMATNVNEANTEVTSQASLIAQIQTALEGKTGGGAETAEYTGLLDDLETAIDALPEAGSGGGGGSVETCTLTITNYGMYYELIAASYSDGQMTSIFYNLMDANEQGQYTTTHEVVQGSMVFITALDSEAVDSICTNCEVLSGHDMHGGMYGICVRVDGDATIEL